MNPIKGTVNSVELIGWLRDEPEERFATNGMAIASFSVATKRRTIQQEDGTWMYETEWTDVEAHDKLAETVTMNLKKGSRVRVSGSLLTNTWQDRNGLKHKTTVVRVEDVMFLDIKMSMDDAVMAEASD
ncbi:MAG: single-stranded DNA-binding protein [Herpetosiphonaceae bacterium]|nr:single-stranded DNA-binding protein [Herpetosiphonaceae bacterium]